MSFFTFRAYHALPPLSTADGIPTNAVHGVAQMLERLFRTEKPDHVAACFDAAGRGFRNEIYDAYKANRTEPDAELKAQFPYVRRLIDAMAICCVEVAGYEADDLLATLAKRLSDQGHEVVIVTGDKDLMQCVNERVSLYDPIRELRMGPAEVVERFGVRPEAVTDVQGLMGDSVDNIPGVPGIGPKTAAALIQHFGSLEAMLERPEEIDRLSIRGAARMRDKIISHAEVARLSKRLATTCADVPVDKTIEDMRFTRPHTPELLKLAEQLEMGRLAARIRAVVETTPEAPPATGTLGVSTDGGGQVLMDFPGSASTCAFSGEWKSLAGGVEVMFVLATVADTPARLALAQGGARILVTGEQVAVAVRELSAQGVSFSGNDVKMLCRSWGLEPGPQSIDLGVASYLYDADIGAHGYGAVVERFLGEAPVQIDDPAGLAGALEQVVRLVPILRAALGEREQVELYESIERPLIGVLGAMEARGIRLDVGLLASLSVEFEERMAALVRRIYDAAGCEFNILSPIQLREVLFTKLALPVRGIKVTKTGPSTDSDSLEALAGQHPLPALVVEYRGLAKLKSTYLDALPRLVDGQDRVHTCLNQTVAATGRLSSSDPNLQNIPIRTADGARIRRAFVAEPGHVLISADYNQIELRVLAHLARDDAFVAAFREGRDIHAATAAEVFEVPLAEVTPSMRRAAKTINFGIIYGMGPVRLARELAITRTQATEYIDRYFKRYAGVRGFFQQTLEQARRQGFVSTLLGRRRYLSDINSDHMGHRQLAERMATNTPIQGSAADIIKLAMVRLAAALRHERLEAAMVLQIHDELLVECPEAELNRALAVIRAAMEGAAQLIVPIVVDIRSATNWAEAH